MKPHVLTIVLVTALAGCNRSNSGTTPTSPSSPTPLPAAPAAVTSLEVLISLGATHIIGCGGAGIVRAGFDVGHVIVPTGAIRDEGTSYHYAPADVAVVPPPQALAAIDAVLLEAGVSIPRGMVDVGIFA